MLDKITLSLARSYYADSGLEYDEGDIEVYSYGLQMFLATVFDILFVLVLGLCIGKFFETAVFLAAFISLRSSAGGYHAKDYLRCLAGLLVVYGLHLAILILTPAALTNHLSLIFLAISIFPILKFAPVEDANKPIGPIQRKTFRKRSVVTLAIQAVIIVGISIFGVIPYILLSFAMGLLTASGSLVAVIIRNSITARRQQSE